MIVCEKLQPLAYNAMSK